MDIKKFIENEKLSNFPVGLGGCRISDHFFDSCGHDVVVFDEKSEPKKIIKFENEFVIIHHASLSRNSIKKTTSIY
jgi:hypothetical protein